jgi:hypothetical protein
MLFFISESVGNVSHVITYCVFLINSFRTKCFLFTYQFLNRGTALKYDNFEDVDGNIQSGYA